ncbi:hypothetical protein YC2023_050079 [Brassica napus]
MASTCVTSKTITKITTKIITSSNCFFIDLLVGLDEKGGCSLSVKEASYYRETAFALRLAKEVIKMQPGCRGNAIAHMNRTNGFSKTLANSCTD